VIIEELRKYAPAPVAAAPTAHPRRKAKAVLRSTELRSSGAHKEMRLTCCARGKANFDTFLDLKERKGHHARFKHRIQKHGKFRELRGVDDGAESVG